MGRLDEARQGYRDGTTAAVPGDILLAIAELDWHMREQAGKTVSPDVRTAATLIRDDLVKAAAG